MSDKTLLPLVKTYKRDLFYNVTFLIINKTITSLLLLLKIIYDEIVKQVGGVFCFLCFIFRFIEHQIIGVLS